MRSPSARIRRLAEADRRYLIGAYLFLQDALEYARHHLELGSSEPTDYGEEPADPDEPLEEPHLSGAEVCQAVRQFALSQYGMLARTVLANWGIRTTSDIGNVVYNMIEIGEFKKSKRDRRADFDNVFEFDEAFHYDMPAPKGLPS